MKSIFLVLAILLTGMALNAQKLYEGTETIDGFEFKWSVWNAAGHPDKYSVGFDVLKAGVISASFEVDLTVSDGTTTKTEHYMLSMYDGKVTALSFKTGFPIVDKTKKLKVLKFSNFIVKKQKGGNSVNTN